jgi:hypothetical protein
MDLAQSLVRSCVRSFYDTKHILVVDALIIHSAYVSWWCLMPLSEDVDRWTVYEMMTWRI